MVAIKNLLHGCEPGRIQTVGWMQVIPLTSELVDDRFVSPAQAKVSTTGYGRLNVRNTEDKPTIVPTGATYIVEQAAQNHALPHAGIVKAKTLKEFNTAMCVQRSQGGYIKEGAHELMLLPVPLREQAHIGRRRTEYNRLWPAIAEFNRSVGVSDLGGGHLELFFAQFKDQLESFVAQFEPVPKQVGAIILVGGKVAGIERMPNHAFFDSMWRPLIRECYGSLALQAAKKHGTPPVPKTRVPLSEAGPRARTLTELRKNLEKAEAEEYNRVASIVDNLMDMDIPASSDEKDGSFTIEGLSGQQFVGQAIREGEKAVYASLVATAYWQENQTWLMAKPFKMKRQDTTLTPEQMERLRNAAPYGHRGPPPRG